MQPFIPALPCSRVNPLTMLHDPSRISYLRNLAVRGWKNRYVRVSLLFLVWVIFLDKSRLVSQESLSNDIARLEEEKQDYERLIGEVKREQEEISRNPEKYAREHYFMKRADEDIFIVKE